MESTSLLSARSYENQYCPALFYRRCQFLKHTRPSLPYLIPGLDGLAYERIGREILPVEVVRARGCLAQLFAGAISKKFMDCCYIETDNVVAASGPLDLWRMHILAGATGIVVSTHAIGKDDVLEAAEEQTSWSEFMKP